MIGFIRHGVTDWNAEKRIQGRTDIPLNVEGRKQAMAMAERLKDEAWDIICASDLSRAAETARIVAERQGNTVSFLDERLRERCFGDIEGTTEEERLSRWKTPWPEFDVGVETEEEMQARIRSFMEEMARTYKGKKILAVTHGGWIVHALKGYFPHLEFGWIGNTSFTKVAYQDGVWKPVLVNCMVHLQDETK